MIKNVLTDIKKIDLKIKKVMIKGFTISLLITLFSCYILALYITYPFSHIVYLSAINLLRLGIACFVSFFVCSFGIDKIIG